MGTFLEDYYNKFNEEKRLTSRHGQIEFRTSIHYIHECIEELKREGRENIKIMDIGAGTGRYSVCLVVIAQAAAVEIGSGGHGVPGFCADTALHWLRKALM